MVDMDAYELEQSYLPIDDDIYYDDHEGAEYLIDDSYIEHQPHWTPKRVVWFLIALVIIVAMIGMLLMPLLQAAITPMPSYMPPPVTPPSQL